MGEVSPPRATLFTSRRYQVLIPVDLEKVAVPVIDPGVTSAVRHRRQQPGAGEFKFKCGRIRGFGRAKWENPLFTVASGIIDTDDDPDIPGRFDQV